MRSTLRGVILLIGEYVDLRIDGLYPAFSRSSVFRVRKEDND